MAQSSLAEKILGVMEAYEKDWEQKLLESEQEKASLSKQVRRLQAELEKGKSALEEIIDDALKGRLSRLGSAPLDTIIREAGVVLEDRLRQHAGQDGSSLYGVGLVDAVLTPGKEKLIFSSHHGEQEGVRMLYRGAMQFVRNPPMHKLIEYSESSARPLIRLVDSLLLLLDEGERRMEGEVAVDDVRRMLTRIPIAVGQKQFYRVLYEAGDDGLSYSELCEAINRTRAQLAGVLGALGRRINNTEGLRGKGGITTVLDISMTADGEYHYRMRPVLREALEAEKIV